MMIESNLLTYILVKKDDLEENDLAQMLHLMQNHYSHVTEMMFLHDLLEKDFVGIIRDKNSDIQGFTTFVINPKNCAGRDYNILFSGDTIIDEKHWGSLIMMKGWSMSVGSIVASDSDKPWYWYLMSKGHRTYLYLPFYFHSYYPSIHPQSDYGTLAQIADEVSRNLFGDDWKPDEGLIRFKEHHGALNPALSEATFRKIKHTYVKFFLEKNPAFYDGNELVCIAQLSQENILRSARQYFIEGTNLKLP
ncbi:MAG: hypothetical protein KA270_16405 [Saprospiraceae bacterium]|nr:hypothetical protein [Saprospiraceae bacterium]MBP6568756.1 hypothetical protein [Saprospiraceae bacterium]